jgi:hypothetical protein
MAGRWDFLYEVKPVPLREHLVEELGRLVAEDLSRWPLAVESFAIPGEATRFAPLLEGGAPRPGPAVFRAAFLLARLELERELEQIDDYMRNERWRPGVHPGAAYDAMILISRYLTEQMLSVLERTGGRVPRARLVECLRRAEQRLIAGAPRDAGSS